MQTVREVLTTVIETLVGCRQGKDEGAGCVSTPRLKWWTILDLNQWPPACETPQAMLLLNATECDRTRFLIPSGALTPAAPASD